MAINIKFDLAGNPEPPTILLATKNGNILGQLDVNQDSIDISDKFNDASEFSFTLNKYVNDKVANLWDKVVNFKLVYCEEWNMWFEITVELDEETETVKTVFCKQLGQAELSQIKLYNIHINEEGDSNWNTDNETYKSTILYDENNQDVSLLHRLLKDKAPHYSVIHVDPTIAKLKRSFSFDDTSIYDAFMDIAEEIGCLFLFHSNSDENGKIQRTISVHDLQQNCLNSECKHRGEFIDKCPKCGNTNIRYGYGEDTLIFVTSDELASGGIELTIDTDAIKNCFKLETGDDLMTATVRNCNPNGTDYIWRFSEDMKSDMSKELKTRLKDYDDEYEKYYSSHESKLDENLVIQYNELVEKYKNYYNTKSTCLNCKNEAVFDGNCPNCGSSNVLSGKSLLPIQNTIIGYSSLMNAYYNVIDLSLYLESALMPSVEMSETNAKEQASLLTTSSLSPVAVNTDKIDAVSLSTAESAVLSMAKIIVKSTYKVEVNDSNYDKNTHVWSGSFIITNYSDENDTAEVKVGNIVVNNDAETFAKQKIEKALNKDDTDDYSISGLFAKEYDDFCNELKKYALNPLKSFYDACDACINILIDQGAGNESEKPDLYKNLYLPYYNKSNAISKEIQIREEEINLISGVYDEKGMVKTDGIKQCIEDCRKVIQDALNFENYLGEDLWLEFCCYRREDKYSNDNYISDGLNNAELFKKASAFFEVAENEIYKASESQHSISTTLNNLLAIPKFKKLVDSFSVGNWIRVQVDEEVYKLRLLEYGIDFGSFDNIPVEFSDVVKIKNGITDVQEVLSQASSMATSYSSVKRQASQGKESKSTVDEWISKGLNSAQVRIQSNDTEDVVMDKNGLLCRSYDEINDIYSPEQLRITHNIMAYTDDDWITVKQAIGKHDYKYFNEETSEFIDSVGYGLNAEFVTAGVVTGSQIIGGNIYSDNYSITDGTGSYLNLRDGTFSFGGGSLVFKDGNLLVSSPDIPTADTITKINKEYIETASIYAKNLEVDSTNIQGQLTASQINTTGLIAENISGTTISGKIISGGSITIGDNFSVDTNGVLSASEANISGTITSINGMIGGFVINENFLVSEDGSIRINSNGNVYFRSPEKEYYETQNGDLVECYKTLDLYGGTLQVSAYAPNNSIVLPSIDIYNDCIIYNTISSTSLSGTEMWAVFGNFEGEKQLALYDGYIQAPYIYCESNIRIGTNMEAENAGTTTSWQDGEFHYIFNRFSDFLTSGFGWAGSSEYSTITKIRGRTCQYQNSSGTTTLSDERLKKDFADMGRWESFYDSLEPVAFKMKNGNSGRYHMGFKAQQVERALLDNGLTTQDFAGFIKMKYVPDEEDAEGNDVYKEAGINSGDDEYGLIYSEFTAMNTYEIQKLKKEVAFLKECIMKGD